MYVIDSIVQEDVMFNSSSTAAVFVSGRSKNGLCTWITEKGQKLGDYILSKQVQPTGALTFRSAQVDIVIMARAEISGYPNGTQ